MTAEELKAKLLAAGVPERLMANMDEKALKSLARAAHVDTKNAKDEFKHECVLEEHTTKGGNKHVYAKSNGCILKDGTFARGFYLQANEEVLDLAIQDLLAVKAQLFGKK